MRCIHCEGLEAEPGSTLCAFCQKVEEQGSEALREINRELARHAAKWSERGRK